MTTFTTSCGVFFGKLVSPATEIHLLVLICVYGEAKYLSMITVGFTLNRVGHGGKCNGTYVVSFAPEVHIYPVTLHLPLCPILPMSEKG